MVDWVKANLPLSTPLDLPHGHVIKLSPSGEVEWDTMTWHDVRGSGGTSVRLRAWPSYLEISGNPCKWFQGHNLWGSDDLVGLTADLAHSALAELGAWVVGTDAERWAAGDFDVKLAHATVMLELGSDDAVLAYLRWLDGSVASRRGRGQLFKGSTLVWGSRALRMKAYHKLGELLDTRGLTSHSDQDRLLAWVSGKLRWEVELRSRELKRLKLHRGMAWRGRCTTSLALGYTDLVEVPMKRSADLSLVDAPKHLRGTLFLWSQGADVRGTLSRPTYYRHRRELLGLGVDISKPPDELAPEIPVSSFPRLRDLPLAELPEWATEPGFYYTPR